MKADAIDQRAWHPTMTIEEYHDDLSHDSNSSLAMFNDSEARYYHTRITKRIKRKPTTDVQRSGHACHTALIEPERLDAIAVIPEEALATNGAKAGKAWDEWKAAHDGKIHLKREEYDLLRWKVDAVWSNQAAIEMLSKATVQEFNIFWIDAQGYRLKARLDLAIELEFIVGDVKNTTRDESTFWKNVRDYGLHRQAAIYCDGFHAFYGVQPEFRYLIVRDEPPFDTCVRVLPQAALELGRKENAFTLANLYACKRGGRPWTPEGCNEVRELVLPPFFYPYTDGPTAERTSNDY